MVASTSTTKAREVHNDNVEEPPSTPNSKLVERSKLIEEAKQLSPSILAALGYSTPLVSPRTILKAYSPRSSKAFVHRLLSSTPRNPSPTTPLSGKRKLFDEEAEYPGPTTPTKRTRLQRPPKSSTTAGSNVTILADPGIPSILDELEEDREYLQQSRSIKPSIRLAQRYDSKKSPKSKVKKPSTPQMIQGWDMFEAIGNQSPTGTEDKAIALSPASTSASSVPSPASTSFWSDQPNSPTTPTTPISTWSSPKSLDASPISMRIQRSKTSRQKSASPSASPSRVQKKKTSNTMTMTMTMTKKPDRAKLTAIARKAMDHLASIEATCITPLFEQKVEEVAVVAPEIMAEKKMKKKSGGQHVGKGYSVELPFMPKTKAKAKAKVKDDTTPFHLTLTPLGFPTLVPVGQEGVEGGFEIGISLN